MNSIQHSKSSMLNSLDLFNFDRIDRKQGIWIRQQQTKQRVENAIGSECASEYISSQLSVSNNQRMKNLKVYEESNSDLGTVFSKEQIQRSHMQKRARIPLVLCQQTIATTTVQNRDSLAQDLQTIKNILLKQRKVSSKFSQAVCKNCLKNSGKNTEDHSSLLLDQQHKIFIIQLLRELRMIKLDEKEQKSRKEKHKIKQINDKTFISLINQAYLRFLIFKEERCKQNVDQILEQSTRSSLLIQKAYKVAEPGNKQMRTSRNFNSKKLRHFAQDSQSSDSESFGIRGYSQMSFDTNQQSLNIQLTKQTSDSNQQLKYDDLYFTSQNSESHQNIKFHADDCIQNPSLNENGFQTPESVRKLLQGWRKEMEANQIIYKCER